MAKWCAKWRIKLNPEKTKVIIFSRSPLARKSEPILKLYGERLKIYPQVKFLGITFDSKLTFQKDFEEILGRCNTRYHRVRLIVNKKWGPSPSTILQIYKQCVRPIFEYGSLSTITMSDMIISKIQRLQNKFIRLALRLPKYISVKLLHDSSGLPYVKDRLLSCATRTLERISKNPLVEESITFNRVNPAWDRFPAPLSVIHPVSLQTNMTYRGNFSKHPVAPKQVVWPIPGHFGTVFGLRIKANTGYSASLSFLGCSMRPTSSWVKERSSQYLIYLVIISNSQPYNKFLHIEKNNKKF